jgi:FixJ family two-component response regulator
MEKQRLARCPTLLLFVSHSSREKDSHTHDIGANGRCTPQLGARSPATLTRVRSNLIALINGGFGMANVLGEDSHVFVIDDDASVRQALASLLQSVALNVEAFGSPVEFFKRRMADDIAAACLILDVRLPGVSGLDFQAELVKSDSHLPIIFISGYGDIPMTVRAMKAGAVEFLTKPFREQDLLDAVQLARQRDRDRRIEERAVLQTRARFDALTPREQEILGLVTAGLMNKQVAAELGVSEITIKVHRGNVMKKMGARSLADLVRMADALGIRQAKH